MTNHDYGYIERLRDAQYADDDIRWCIECEKYMMVKHVCMPKVVLSNE